jgi:hypothetical protein
MGVPSATHPKFLNSRSQDSPRGHSACCEWYETTTTFPNREVFLTKFLGDTTKPFAVRKAAKFDKRRLEKGLKDCLRDFDVPGSPWARKYGVKLRIKTGKTITTHIIPPILPENDEADEAHLTEPMQSLRYRFGAGARKKPWASALEACQDTATRVAKRVAMKREEERKRRALGGMKVMRRRVV